MCKPTAILHRDCLDVLVTLDALVTLGALVTLDALDTLDGDGAKHRLCRYFSLQHVELSMCGQKEEFEY